MGTDCHCFEHIIQSMSISVAFEELNGEDCTFAFECQKVSVEHLTNDIINCCKFFAFVSFEMLVLN